MSRTASWFWKKPEDCTISGQQVSLQTEEANGYNSLCFAEKAWLRSVCIPNLDVCRNNKAATADDADWKRVFGERDESGAPVYYLKTQNTAESTSFCVVSIDRKNRKLHFIAYGAGYDRELCY